MRNKVWVGVRDDGVESVESVSSRFCSLGEIGSLRKSGRLLENAKKIAVPFKVAMSKRIRKIDGVEESVTATMSFDEERIRRDVISISVCMIGELIIEGTKSC